MRSREEALLGEGRGPGPVGVLGMSTGSAGKSSAPGRERRMGLSW